MSFKGVLLEGLEVVFIVITFGLNADACRPRRRRGGRPASSCWRRGGRCTGRSRTSPRTRIKFAVGLLLSTFGTFWAIEGLGVFAAGSESLEWPGGDVWLPILLAACAGLSRLAVLMLRRPPREVAVAGD